MESWKRTILAVAVTLWPTLAYAQPASSPALPPEAEHEMRLLCGQLSDPARAARTKVEAAELLLTRSYPQATDALKDFLADSGNRAAQIAVAEAIARQQAAKEPFVDPLMAMLTGDEPSVRAPAAKALVIYRNPAVISRLVSIAQNTRADRQLRLVVIASLQGVLDRGIVDALVLLLDDADAAVRDAAAASLGKLTNIPFGNDVGQWKEWWNANKNKPQSQWLADLAQSLARSKADLEAENLKLRERLARSMIDMYEATPLAQRDALILAFLKDGLADVRLTGTTLADRRLETGSDLPQDLRSQIRSMITDSDARVRQSAVLVLAALGEADSVPALLELLKNEESQAVRQAMLAALGQFQDPKAVPAVIGEIAASRYDNVAAAAAEALGRIAARNVLSDQQRTAAATALKARYELVSRQSDGAAVRESLLTAMSQIGGKDFLPAMQAGLKDSNAAVRLAAVNGLAKLGDSSLADALVPLVSDPADRSVRGAAVVALANLGGEKYLQTIFQRTDPSVEADAAVRKQAWDLTMAMLSKANEDDLSVVIDSLSDRTDGRDQLIKVMELRVALLRSKKSDKLAAAHRQLGAVLMQANRPADAAAHLAEAWALLLAAQDETAAQVWNEWVDALLESNDRLAAKVLADQPEQQDFEAALERLESRCVLLAEAGKHSAVIEFCEESFKQLSSRLSDTQRAAFRKLLDDARGKRAAEDRNTVARLCPLLAGADESARRAALGELGALGDRAVGPMLEELKRVVAADPPNPALEKAIHDAVKQLAPRLAGYDLDASKQDRLKLLDSWLKTYQ